jgi:hypothetical protein
MIERNRNKSGSKPKNTPRDRPSRRARAVEREAASQGVEPLRRVEDLALGSPRDADDLLAAIREHRKACGEAS